jgi:LMBR1-like membrane protein
VPAPTAVFASDQNKVRRLMWAQMLNDVEMCHSFLSFQIFVLLFLLLLVGSYTLIERFRRRDQKDLYSTEDDELKVYRISLLFCIFSFAVAIGSAFLLPLSIISNEVLLLYPNSYYVQWLNSSLIQGLWNHVFLCSNLAIFVLLPFAYLFSESSGFLGHKKGIVPRLYETSVVFVLLIFVVIGLIYVLLAVFYPERSSFLSMLSKLRFYFVMLQGFY